MLRGGPFALPLPRLRRGRKDRRTGRARGSRSHSPRMELQASDKASTSARCASPGRAAGRARGPRTGRRAASRQGSGRHRPPSPPQGPAAAGRARPLPARRPPGSTPARAAHALRPPLKGPARSRRVLRLPQPALCPKLSLGGRGSSASLSPLSQGAAKPARSRGGSSQRAARSANCTEIPGSGGPRSGIS